MIRIRMIVLLSLLLAGSLAAQQTQQAKPATEKEKISYSLGASLARNMKGQKVDLDYAMLIQGLKDAMAGQSALSEQDMQTILSTFYNDVLKKKIEEQRTMVDQNKKNGESFLAENKTKDGVITLPDGLQYRVLKQGTGPKPTATSEVEVHYRGTLIDGKEFDSSYKRGKPAKFPLDGVIKGWTEALQLMPVGSKWEIYLPSELAYGGRQVGPLIAPYSTLIFEIELLSIAPSE